MDEVEAGLIIFRSLVPGSSFEPGNIQVLLEAVDMKGHYSTRQRFALKAQEFDRPTYHRQREDLT